MRLNETVTCEFCQCQVNPYVISHAFSLTTGAATTKVECPNCGKDFILDDEYEPEPTHDNEGYHGFEK